MYVTDSSYRIGCVRYSARSATPIASMIARAMRWSRDSVCQASRNSSRRTNGGVTSGRADCTIGGIMRTTTVFIAGARAIAIASLITLPIQAQDPARVRAGVRAYAQANDVAVLRELVEFLAIPNLASDSVNIRRNARHIMQMLERRGARAQLLETPGAPPAVFGELRTPGATRTVMFYAHYDGQPVDTTQWASAPWTPTLRSRALGAGGEVIPMPTQPGTVRSEEHTSEL